MNIGFSVGLIKVGVNIGSSVGLIRVGVNIGSSVGLIRVGVNIIIIIIIQFLYSANSRMADRCAAQEKY